MTTHYPGSLPLSPPACAATVGFFDGVHLGHQHLVAQLRELAGREGLQTAVVTFEQHPRTVLETHPAEAPLLLSKLDEKVRLLQSLGVDHLVVLRFDRQMAQLTAREFMQRLRERLNVRVLLSGYDHRFGHNRSEGFDDYVRYGKEMGMSVVRGRPLRIDGQGVSSSRVRRCLLSGDVEAASRCLGRDYTLAGTVVSGDHIGRLLGFPTANVSPSESSKLVPAAGVYGVKVCIAGENTARDAMMNIGMRPTFGGHCQTLEAHIFGYSGDLYGRQVDVSFAFRQREECRFASPEQLAEQLRCDAKEIADRLAQHRS